MAASAPAVPAKPKGPKLSYKEQKELESLPSKIETLEAEQAAIATRLADPATYQGEPAVAKGLTDRASAIEEELMTAMERWDLLEAKQKEAAG